MADAAALVRAASNTAKMTSSVKKMWETRTKLRATLNDSTSQDLAIRAQIDEVFLVLAHLGEALLPLGVFNKDYYPQSLGEVQASIDNCGHDLLPLAWKELDPDVQFVCTAGLAFCAVFSPMHVYRGFGACVLGDWDWACPDMHHLEEKARKKAVWTVYGVKQKSDPQPMKSVFVAFDHAIQMLQVKPLAFLEKKPSISGFAEHQPRYGSKPKKEVKHDLDLLEGWVKQLERRGHPVPTDSSLTSWGIPFATWNSPYSYHTLKTEKDCETLMLHQTDPGRILHALICRGSSNLDEGQILLLMPRSPTESLMCWLEGLPGTSHKIVRWKDLNTERFETKISKSLRKKIGHYPIPTQFAIRNPQATKRPPIPTAASAPAVLELPNSVSPPPYTSGSKSKPKVAELHDGNSRPVAELGASEATELPGDMISHPDTQKSASSPLKKAETASAVLEKPSSAGLKTISTLRRKLTPSIVVSSPGPSTTSPNADSSVAKSPNDTNHVEAKRSDAVELPTELPSRTPESVLTEPNEKGQGTDRSKDAPSIEQPKASTSGQYLELLNKVAKGEISPQELSHLLNTVTMGGHVVESGEAGAGGESHEHESPQVSSNEGSKSSSLPYPTTPVEKKPNSASTLPYPVTPTEKSAATNVKSEAADIEVPASLKPGSSS